MADCSNPPTTLDADADIVGPGVLAAFFATATVTIAAVIFAYLSDTLDKKYMNELDRRIIASTQRGWRRLWELRLLAIIRTYWCRLWKIQTDSENLSDSDSEGMREVWKETVTQFILTLSDQQLVTGLAILIAGASSPQYLSGYEFTVVLGLAWFSSTTHLVTLTALRTYLDSHGIIRDVRVGGMLIVLALLLYSLIISFPLARSTLPVQCTLESGFAISPIESMALIASILMLTSSYLVRLSDLYADALPAHASRVRYSWSYSKYGDEGLSYEEFVKEVNAERRLSEIILISRSKHPRRWLRQASYLYQGSFLSTLPGVAFSYVYGLSQVVAYRWLLAPALTADSTRMGFGQIMSILLLLLPALAAGETYCDYRNKRLEKLARKAEAKDLPKDHSDTGTAEEPVSPQGSAMPAKKPVDPETEYKEHIQDIRKYFCRETRIRIEDSPKCNAEEILRRKRILIEKYKTVKALEEQREPSSAVWIFALNVAAYASIAALLNTGRNLILVTSWKHPGLPTSLPGWVHRGQKALAHQHICLANPEILGLLFQVGYYGCTLDVFAWRR